MKTWQDMTDRELLELAAKAAGIILKPMQFNNVTKQGDDRFIGLSTDCEQWPREWFNPLNNGGDALRLAVKLVLKIEQRDGCIGVQWVDRRGNPEEWPDYLAVPINGDPYAATRRAIVCAAAEIGRNMK